MLHIDDLIEPRPEQILFFRRSSARIVPSDAAEESLFALKGIPKMKLQASEPSGPKSLQSQIRPWPQKRLSINRLGVVHRQLHCLNRQRTAGASALAGGIQANSCASRCNSRELAASARAIKGRQARRVE